jgi:hypothetical protein
MSGAGGWKVRTSCVTLLTGALLLGATTAAVARDYCFMDSLGLPPLVAKNFALPTAGRCTGFTGSFQDGAFLASGMSCGSWDVDNVNVEIDIDSPIDGEMVRYSFFVNRQTMKGEGAILCAPIECGVVFGIPLGSLAFSIHEVACRPN